MSDTRYYAITECAHGSVESHPYLNQPIEQCPGGTRRELAVPGDMTKPTLMWVDYDVSVFREQADGYVSVDGDAMPAALSGETGDTDE